jgi:hypothetical protein
MYFTLSTPQNFEQRVLLYHEPFEIDAPLSAGGTGALAAA